jgi:hypothetical protein
MLISLSQILSLNAWARNYDGADAPPPPSASQQTYSKLIGIMVKDKNGQVECVTGMNGPVSGFKPCDSQMVSLAMAEKPSGARANVRTAGMPLVLLGASASCAMTGAFSEAGAELFQKYPRVSEVWQALSAIKGASLAWDGMTSVLAAIWKGAAVATKAWPAAQVAVELSAVASTAVMVPVTVAVCVGSYQGGRMLVRGGVDETVKLAKKKIYYFFSKNPRDVQGN